MSAEKALAEALEEAVLAGIKGHCFDDGDGRIDEMTDVDTERIRAALDAAGYEVRPKSQRPLIEWNEMEAENERLRAMLTVERLARALSAAHSGSAPWPGMRTSEAFAADILQALEGEG